MTAPEQAPGLRIINADATDEEVAAIVASLAALGAQMSSRSRRGSEWAAPDRAVRLRYSHGAGGWVSSSRPR